MTDLKLKPYNLNDEQIAWVNNTLNHMSVDDKLKQLFTCLTSSRDEEYLKELVKNNKPGGIRYNPASSVDVLKHNKILQANSEIPVLIAANTENGGAGACKGGTEVGFGTKVGSTQDLHLAYQMGYISAKEAKAIGVNTLFSPIVDIHHDFHNPIIAYKCFGNNPELVKDMSLEYLKGVQDVGIIACAKHFPGDGYDERDQHLAPSMNPLSMEEWDKSFGLVYKSLIDQGLPMIMAGHISLPSYENYFNKDAKGCIPATVSKALITDLLKGKLGFNGVVTTDATHMVALNCSMKRSEYIPQIIASGCDMILFYNDFEEDMKYIKDGYEKGIITDERLNDAVTRILGLKAMLGYHKENAADQIKEENISIVGCEEHKKVAKEVSKKGITLVKNLEKDLLPLNPNKTKRILIVPHNDENPFEMFMPKGMPTIYDYIVSKLQAEGFEVTLFESLMDKIKKLPPQEAMKFVGNVYNNKTPITSITDNYDLIIHVCDFDSHNTTTRIVWKMSKGTPDIPWYVYEVPTMVISLKNPFHLFDVPQIKTYINAYDKNKDTIDILVDKLVGREEFIGISPVDAYCGDEVSKY